MSQNPGNSRRAEHEEEERKRERQAETHLGNGRSEMGRRNWEAQT
jgi:hypothetical protein